MSTRQKILNLTPHALNIRGGGGIVTIPPSGNVARVSVSYADAGEVEINGVSIPVKKAMYGDIDGLPAPVSDSIFIVSGMVAGRVSGRPDVFSPGELIRDKNGKPIGGDGLKVN